MLKLIDLYKKANVNQISGFAAVAKNLDITELCEEYAELCSTAPQRSKYDKSYFISSHNGITSSDKPSNRREELLAIDIYNASRAGKRFTLPDGRNLDIIDYQTPLKSKQGDQGIGKVDLFGVTDKTLPTVIELKVEGQNGGYSDSPLRALLEGLAYCAIVEANISVITKEASEKFYLTLSAITPTLIVLAPEAYWIGYLNHPKAGPWLPELNRIIEGLRKQLNLDTQLIGIRNFDFTMGDCELISVQQMADDI